MYKNIGDLTDAEVRNQKLSRYIKCYIVDYNVQSRLGSSNRI